MLLICDDLGLIGKEMFAVDGCKMPSNASKEWSGTRAELKKKAEKIDRAVRYMLKKHRDEDKKGHAEESIRKREEKQIARLLAASDKIEAFLETKGSGLTNGELSLDFHYAQKIPHTFSRCRLPRHAAR